MEINAKRRRDILPWWIKIFSWIFMIIGLLLVVVIALLLFGFQPELAIYGFDASDNYPFNLVLILIIFLCNSVLGYALWSEKKWAIIFGKIVTYIAILLCFSSMIISLLSNQMQLRLELFLLVIFLIKLYKMNNEWLSSNEQ